MPPIPQRTPTDPDPPGSLARVVAVLNGRADLLAVSGSDPLVLTSLRRREDPVLALRLGPALVWTASDVEERRRYLHGLGPAPDLVALLASAAALLPLPCRATLPRAVPAALAGSRVRPAGHSPGAHLRLVEPVDWVLRWVGTPPVPVPGEDRVRWLTPGVPEVDEEVNALLDTAAPRSSTRPGDPGVRRWAGIYAHGGELHAVAADTSGDASVGHISSVATHPMARGRGLAAAVTAALTRDLLASGAAVVTLGHYAGNAVAERLYDRLGFAARSLSSGALEVVGARVAGGEAHPGCPEESTPASRR